MPEDNSHPLLTQRMLGALPVLLGGVGLGLALMRFRSIHHRYDVRDSRGIRGRLDLFG